MSLMIINEKLFFHMFIATGIFVAIFCIYIYKTYRIKRVATWSFFYGCILYIMFLSDVIIKYLLTATNWKINSTFFYPGDVFPISPYIVIDYIFTWMTAVIYFEWNILGNFKPNKLVKEKSIGQRYVEKIAKFLIFLHVIIYIEMI